MGDFRKDMEKAINISEGLLDEPYPESVTIIYDEYTYDKRLEYNLPDILYLSMRKQWKERAEEKFLIYYSKETLKRVKKRLREKGFINDKPLDAEYIKKKTIELSHKGLKCEWCGKEAYTLHEHHYPIPKAKGGTETVSICPNCHYTFHVIKRKNHV